MFQSKWKFEWTLKKLLTVVCMRYWRGTSGLQLLSLWWNQMIQNYKSSKIQKIKRVTWEDAINLIMCQNLLYVQISYTKKLLSTKQAGANVGVLSLRFKKCKQFTSIRATKTVLFQMVSSALSFTSFRSHCPQRQIKTL